MAKPVTFVERVQQSGLVEEDQLIAMLRDIKHEEQAGGKPFSDEVVARRLVEAGLCTPWQCDQLLEGHYKGFFLGKYRLLSLLGGGGMSKVYLADHVLMRRRVAVKVLPRNLVEQKAYLDRFYYEAKAAATVDHPNIVRAYDFEVSGGPVPYLVMEYVDGQDLQKTVEEHGPLDYAVAADYICQAAEGLAHAHEMGLIHRDVKPLNLMVDRRNVVKVLDLGLALSTNEKRALLGSANGKSVLGTREHLAPEQAEDSNAVDLRADIYGLGSSLYFLLTGHPPFATSPALATIKTKTPPSIYNDRPGAPRELVEICAKMMAKNRADRYSSAGEVAAVLAGWLAEHKRGSAPEPGSGSGGSGGLTSVRPFPAAPHGLSARMPPVRRHTAMSPQATVASSSGRAPASGLRLDGSNLSSDSAASIVSPAPVPPRRRFNANGVGAKFRKPLPRARPLDSDEEFVFGDLLDVSRQASSSGKGIASGRPHGRTGVPLPRWLWPAIAGGLVLGLALLALLLYSSRHF